MRPVLNGIDAEFDMTGRCPTCNKRVRRRKSFRATAWRTLLKKVAHYNKTHPFYCKAHKPTEAV